MYLCEMRGFSVTPVSRFMNRELLRPESTGIEKIQNPIGQAQCMGEKNKEQGPEPMGVSDLVFLPSIAERSWAWTPPRRERLAISRPGSRSISLSEPAYARLERVVVKKW
jgi:hypothetical protein